MVCYIIKNTAIVTTLQNELMTTEAHTKWLNLQQLFAYCEKKLS